MSLASQSLTLTSLLRSTPEAQGVSSGALTAFINAAEQNGMELHSLMLLQHGYVVAEGWWAPYDAQHPHMLYSLSKSFTATATGLAINEGHFSLDDSVISFFPEDTPAVVDKNLAALRVRHLLSMSTGHTEDTTRFLRDDPTGNWVRAFLARPIEHEPGTRFLYNSGATYMVSAIVQKVTGRSLMEYLQPRLFKPLGITGATWESCPRGVNVGGWGLSIKSEDIARFGQLYLQKGMWNGARLLPEGWVEEATKRQVSNGTRADSDWEQGYGFQFWCCQHHAYRGDGAFGQYCVVMPEQEAVLAITSNVGDMQALLNLVWEHILPSLGPTALGEHRTAQEHLTHKLATLSIRAPLGQPAYSMTSQVSGKTYHFDNNDLAIIALTLDFDQEEPILTVQDNQGTHRLTCGAGVWRRGTTKFLQHRVWPVIAPSEEWKVAVNGGWTSKDTFEVKLCFYETPFSPMLICRFVEGHRLLVAVRGRIGFGPTEWPSIEGLQE